jgi:hypothetical protein
VVVKCGEENGVGDVVVEDEALDERVSASAGSAGFQLDGAFRVERECVRHPPRLPAEDGRVNPRLSTVLGGYLAAERGSERRL